MTDNEFNAWAGFMMKNAGHWTVDGIHNGLDGQDLLVYVANPNDATTGIFVMIGRNNSSDESKPFSLQTGRFTDAYPHIGESAFHTKHLIPVASVAEGVQIAVERLGISFLLALSHGVSPFRAGTR